MPDSMEERFKRWKIARKKQEETETFPNNPELQHQLDSIDQVERNAIFNRRNELKKKEKKENNNGY